MTITLFEAAQSVREQLEQVDPETGELSEDCTASLDLFRTKATACVAYAIEEGRAIESAAEFVKALAAKIEARKKRHGLFIDYLSGSMKATGVHEIKHEHGLFKAKLRLGRDESVVLEEQAPSPNAGLCARSGGKADVPPHRPSCTRNGSGQHG